MTSRHKYVVVSIRYKEAPIIGQFQTLKAAQEFLKNAYYDDELFIEDIESKDQWSYVGKETKARINRIY